MTPGWWLAAGARGLLAAALAAALVRSRGSRRAARARLGTTTAELERLSHAFARFAPVELVERVIASGVPTRGERKEVTVLFADLFGVHAALRERRPVGAGAHPERLLRAHGARRSPRTTATSRH